MKSRSPQARTRSAHGNHTGAELNFLMREGSRDRLRGQFRPSITDTSLVLEGPLGVVEERLLAGLRAKKLSRLGYQADRSGKHVRVWVSRCAGKARARPHTGAPAAVRCSPPADRGSIRIPRFTQPRRSEGWRQRCGRRADHVALSRVAAIHPDAAVRRRRQHVPQRQPRRPRAASRRGAATSSIAPTGRTRRSPALMFEGGGEVRRIERIALRAGARAASPGVRVRENFSASAIAAPRTC